MNTGEVLREVPRSLLERAETSGTLFVVYPSEVRQAARLLEIGLLKPGSSTGKGATAKRDCLIFSLPGVFMNVCFILFPKKYRWAALELWQKLEQEGKAQEEILGILAALSDMKADPSLRFIVTFEENKNPVQGEPPSYWAIEAAGRICFFESLRPLRKAITPRIRGGREFVKPKRRKRALHELDDDWS